MGLVFVVVFAGIIFAVASAHRRTVEAAWGRAAQTLGLDMHPGGVFGRPSIQGRIGNIAVTVRTVNRGKNNVYTTYSVQYPARTRPFRLSREHAFSGFAKMFGAQDVEIGDNRFDASFMVKAQDPGSLATYLTPSRRTELLSYAASNRSMVATESTVEAGYRGSDNRTDRIISRVRRIVSVAEHLADDDTIHAREDEALELRRGGELRRGVRELRTAVRERPDDYGIRIADIEGRVTTDDVDDAADEAERLAVDLADDDELHGWRREIEAVRRQPEPPRAVTGGDLPADEVIQDLFGTTKLSFETAERFRLNYKDREVDWQGTVRSVRDYSSDHDFGSEPGVKAVVTVAEVAHDLYGNATIDAVIQFPTRTRLRKGDVITFTGRLVKIDPLMRNLYIATATLIDD